MASFKGFQVKSIEKVGFVDIRRPLNERDYLETKKWFFEEHDIELPNIEDLPVKLSEARILLHPLKILIGTNEGTLVYEFDRGFITDFASVPSIFRSAIDNDDSDLVLGAFVHDANFRYHYLSFELSNYLFRVMNEKAGASWFVYFVSWAAVNSPLGRREYNRESKIKDRRVKFFW